MAEIRCFTITSFCVMCLCADLALFMTSRPGRSDPIAFSTQTLADFDFARTGSGPPGRWDLVGDATGAQGEVIEQTSRDRTDYRFPLAIYRPFSAKDAEVSVRFKAMGGDIDRAGGLALRLRGPDDYYVVRANALEDNVRFYRVVRGKREQLAGAATKVASGVWHTLALRAEGDRFTVMFNGKMLFSATDRSFDQAGKVALWTKADSVTRFDQLNVRSLDQAAK